jgi:LPXTG-site transpeptidase (sortase) family protein
VAAQLMREPDSPPPEALERPEIAPPTSDEGSAAASVSPELTPIEQPTRIEIPAIGVDADLVGVGLNADRSMEVPDFGLASWYTKGPAPGESGPAVIAAHVDSYEGPDVFFRLHELGPGDEIRVHGANGRTLTWRMYHSQLVDKDRLPTSRIWSDTPQPALRLITCGGEFDYTERSYESNVIVYASPVNGET